MKLNRMAKLDANSELSVKTEEVPSFAWFQADLREVAVNNARLQSPPIAELHCERRACSFGSLGHRLSTSMSLNAFSEQRIHCCVLRIAMAWVCDAFSILWSSFQTVRRRRGDSRGGTARTLPSMAQCIPMVAIQKCPHVRRHPERTWFIAEWRALIPSGKVTLGRGETWKFA